VATFESSQTAPTSSMTYCHKFLLVLVGRARFIVQEEESPLPQCQPAPRVLSSSKGGSAIVGIFDKPPICLQSGRVSTDPLSSAVLHCSWWTSL